MQLTLRGKRALITGGSHGIGLATAHALAREGCDVAICSRDRVKLANAALELERHATNVVTIPCDVTRPRDIAKVITKITKSWKGVDILINNVGGGGRWGDSQFEKTKVSVWREVYEKNAGAAIQFTMAFIPRMVRQKWGRVVTIASIYGKEGGGRPWFTMAKSAEIALMKTLAMHHDYARAGITFNTVAPGSIMIPDTGWEVAAKKNPRAHKKMLNEKYPLGRLGTPEEVASVVAFLCSPHASLVNGACIVADGAETGSF